MRKILAMLMMAAATTAMVSSCNKDDDGEKVDAKKEDLIGSYSGSVSVAMGSIDVGWAITPASLTSLDTMLITTGTFNIPIGQGVPMMLVLKACNITTSGEQVLFDIAQQSATTAMGALSLSGQGTYNASTKKVNVQTSGTMVTPQQTMPFAVGLNGQKLADD